MEQSILTTILLNKSSLNVLFLLISFCYDDRMTALMWSIRFLSHVYHQASFLCSSRAYNLRAFVCWSGGNFGDVRGNDINSFPLTLKKLLHVRLHSRDMKQLLRKGPFVGVLLKKSGNQVLQKWPIVSARESSLSVTNYSSIIWLMNKYLTIYTFKNKPVY